MESRGQKIIIPKGVVNPSETTIIEIPKYLKQTPVIIAQKPSRPSIERPEMGEQYYRSRYYPRYYPSTRK